MISTETANGRSCQPLLARPKELGAVRKVLRVVTTVNGIGRREFLHGQIVGFV
jgi:hypothetical protein